MILTLDMGSDVPVYKQIFNQIVVGIADGRLKNGDKLPSVRALACEVGVNMMTVDKAYNALKTQGYIVTNSRKGATVCVGNTVSDKLIDGLKIAVSQLKLTGMDKTQVLELCGKLYDGGKS